MKVFVTGASGYIGSQMVRLLLEQGITPYALISPEDTYPWRIDEVVSHLKVINCDLASTAELRRHLLEIKPEIAIHFAWYTGKADYLESTKNLFHLRVSLDLAASLAEAGCRRFVAAGTCIEYDTTAGYLSESSLTKPDTLYGAAKLSLGILLEQISKGTKMECAWTRIFHPYGPREEESRLVPAVIQSLLRGDPVRVSPGEQVRDFLHVRDTVAAIWAVARSHLTGAVNIGSGTPVRLRDVLTVIGSQLGRCDLIQLGARSYRPGDPMFICANNTRLKENTDWRQAFSLEAGIADTIEWWQNAAKPPAK